MPTRIGLVIGMVEIPLWMMLAVGFLSSFLGSSVGVIGMLYLHRKQIEELKKLKRSLQGTVRRLKNGLKEKEITKPL